MRTLHVEAASDGIGGSFFSLRSLVLGLDRSTFEPTVVFARPNPVADEMVADGIRVHLLPRAFSRPINGSRLRFHLGLARAAIHAAQEIRRLESCSGGPFSVVHTNDQLETNAAWILGAALLGRPVVAHERQAGTFRWAHRALSRAIAVHVRVSHYIDEHCRRGGLAPRGAVVVHNGIETIDCETRAALEAEGRAALAEIGVPGGAPVILAPGTVAPWKGTKDIVRALSKLNDSAIHLVVAGSESTDGPGYANQVRGFARMRGLENRVHFAGFRSDIGALMAASHVVVHAARRPEPFGRVPLEAMALERPVVVADAGGVPEVVPDDVGWRVEPGNPTAIAAALEEILNSSVPPRRFEKGAALVRSRFALRHHVKKMAEVFVWAAEGRTSCES